MNTSNTIFLNNPDDTVMLFGKEFSAKELQDALIDSHIYRNRLKEIFGRGDE
ncbi:MAG: hypothetical protein IKF11_00910 [Methanobrevibacter sp.]|nr:hypothetical protein [Methanobrevibacter sp.]